MKRARALKCPCPKKHPTYVSSACLDRKHDQCPGKCKFCLAKCKCECHKPGYRRIAIWREVLDAVLLDSGPKRDPGGVILTVVGALDQEEMEQMLQDMLQFQPAPAKPRRKG